MLDEESDELDDFELDESELDVPELDEESELEPLLLELSDELDEVLFALEPFFELSRLSVR